LPVRISEYGRQLKFGSFAIELSGRDTSGQETSETRLHLRKCWLEFSFVLPSFAVFVVARARFLLATVLDFNQPRDQKMGNRVVLALARTVFLFGLLTWGYVVAMQLRHLEEVYDQLAEWVPIRLDYLGEAAFIVSMVAYFLLKFWETEK
jgi:hypothetical protein